MRKMLKDKKGFTLVELMIVVVIMGILVAVAIPVYNSVTKNAKKKSCDANLNIMQTNAQNFYMTGSDSGDELVDMFGNKAAAGAQFQLLLNDATEEKYGADYAKMFEKGIPTCPAGGTYSVTLTKTDGGASVKASCDYVDHVSG